MPSEVRVPDLQVTEVGRRRAGSGQATEPEAARAHLLEAALERQHVRWEARVSFLMAVLCAVPMMLVLLLWPTIGSRLAASLLLIGVVGACYYGISAIKLRDATPAQLRVLRLINVTIEASWGSLALVLVARLKGSDWAMSGSADMVYFIVLAGTTARMRPMLCLYAAAVMVVEFLLLYHLYLQPGLTPALIEALPTLDAWNAWERAFWIALAGGLSAISTSKARGWARLAGTQAIERRWLEKQFGRYVSRDVADAVLRGEAEFGHAERREVTVLFCDLRDFTAICEQQRPEEVVALLNVFFEHACKIIESNGGTVNKFLGDGVLALFGAPDEHPNHVYAAAESARELLEAANELRRRDGIWRYLGIGVDTGDVLVGAVGGPNRVEYTAIGATVNRAARLQSLSRRGERRVILSQTSAAALGPLVETICLGEVALKGFSAKEPVYTFADTDRPTRAG